MDAGKLVYSILANDATLTAIVNTRIYPGFVPQDTQFPAITYAFDSQFPTKSKDGDAGLDVLDMSLVIYHENYEQAQAAAERCRALLNYYSGTAQGVTVDKITMENQADNSYVSQYEFVVLTQSYKIRLRR
ncbi:MAG: DUF3168 domain-containing protein [Phaeodactylibacter sp.]|nr:DUF3168 domain-containing protein [Phaeodactylibacter sp.]